MKTEKSHAHRFEAETGSHTNQHQHKPTVTTHIPDKDSEVGVRRSCETASTFSLIDLSRLLLPLWSSPLTSLNETRKRQSGRWKKPYIREKLRKETASRQRDSDDLADHNPLN